MRKTQSIFRPLLGFTAAALLTLSLTKSAQADVINFESFSGPSLFGGAMQTLNIATTIGNVKVTGGTVLTAETNLPADTTSVYGTLSFGDTTLSYLNPITITFPVAITNFYLDVYNGNTTPVDYTVADNAGHSQTFTLADNFSSGQSLVAIPATGNVITIYATPIDSDTPWDFSIDNITFDQPLPSPEPSSIAMVGGFGLVFIGLRFLKVKGGQSDV